MGGGPSSAEIEENTGAVGNLCGEGSSGPRRNHGVCLRRFYLLLT